MDATGMVWHIVLPEELMKSYGRDLERRTGDI